MAAPGGPRPGNVPPNYNLNALADRMQHLQINRPNHPPTNPTGGPRPSATPFGQQPSSFAGGPPADRPGPPPPGAFQSGPPGPFAASTGPLVPPSGVSSSASNGPPALDPGTMQSGPRFPPPSNTMRPPAGAPPSAMLSSGTPSQPSSPTPRIRPPFGSPPASTTSVIVQPPPPFLGSTQNVPPSSSSSSFASPVLAMPPPMGAPYGMQTWKTLPHKVAPPSSVPGSMQPPMMFGMASPHSNQAEAGITPSMGHAGSALTGQSKVDSSQIPRPILNSAVILHETRQGNQANPPPPAASDYIVWDTGNCSPRYMRCTVNQIPCTVDLLTTSAMQLALLVQPLALPHPSERPIQTGQSYPIPILVRGSRYLVV